MTSTVLGKRTRSAAAAFSEDPRSPIATRSSKRRAQFVILDEAEKENPFVTPKKNAVYKDEDVMDVEAVEEEKTPAKKRGRKAATTPAKHGNPVRVPLSASKANSPVKAAATCASPEKVVIPQTPRHRDALSKKVAVTPRHRLIVAGRPLTPRTPHTPSTPRNTVPTVYNEARQLFARGSAPTELFGREEERKELETFISTRTKSKKSGCIYVSGPPGTGKSAFVEQVCRTVESNDTVKKGYVNCMSIKDAADLYRKLLEEFVDITEIIEGEEVDALKELFVQRKCSYVVTLDEVDCLLDLDLDLLYNVFEWSLQRSSGLVLIGIANALDFTDRFLPRLKARGLKPHLLPFLPYTAPQITSVITSKLKSLVPSGVEHVPFIHPTAIQFLSKKVASQSGDLRKAFDICKRAIDLIEADTRDHHAKKLSEITPSPTPSPTKTPLVENMNLCSPATRSPSKQKPQTTLTSSLSQLTVETAPRATIAHIARITAAIFSNGTTQRLQNLNLQQKAVLCALAALEKKNRSTPSETIIPSTPSKKDITTAPTIRSLYSAYTKLCKIENLLHPLTSTEFRDIVGSLETLSLVSGVEGKGGSLIVMNPGTPSKRGRGGGGFVGAGVVEDRRVASVVAEKELGAVLTGPGSAILKGILDGQEVL